MFDIKNSLNISSLINFRSEKGNTLSPIKQLFNNTKRNATKCIQKLIYSGLRLLKSVITVNVIIQLSLFYKRLRQFFLSFK